MLSGARTLSALVTTARPRQWVKNLLVIVPALTTGAALSSRAFLPLSLAFVTFCLAASGVYFVNDVHDAEQDRQHPTKRFRPVAAGVLSPWPAIRAGAVLLLAGVGLGLAVHLGIVIALYTANSLAYCFVLRNYPLADVLAVSSGFSLRVIAGTLVCGLPLSGWLVVVSFAGSLFVGAGRRYSEAVTIGEGSVRSRPALAGYALSQLEMLWRAAALVSALAYLVAAVRSFGWGRDALLALSLAPYTVAIVRYAAAVREARAGSPENVVRGDRALQLAGLTWVVIFSTRGLW